ncbi:MAG: hypothetical protein ACREDC_06240, partial [Bradyrhizobium sp.]
RCVTARWDIPAVVIITITTKILRVAIAGLVTGNHATIRLALEQDGPCCNSGLEDYQSRQP